MTCRVLKVREVPVGTTYDFAKGGGESNPNPKHKLRPEKKVLNMSKDTRVGLRVVCQKFKVKLLFSQ